VGHSVLYIATNGIDTSLGGIGFVYFTPLKEFFKLRLIIGGLVFCVVVGFFCFLRYRKFKNKNKRLVANTGGVWERPSINKGIQHQHDTSVRKYGTTKYPLFGTPCRDLGTLGEGIGLYFQFLKQFAQVKKFLK
jgi:hypothetical protein